MKKIVMTLIFCTTGIVFLTGFYFDRGSCARPSLWNIYSCHKAERQILNSTVQLLFHGSVEVEDGYGVQRINGTLSHGTILLDRYLLTHNHFGIRLSQATLFDQYGGGGFSGVSVYTISGEPIVDQASLEVFSIVFEAGETVILDFGLVAGQGFFSQAGLASAELATSASVTLPPGAEVAQIDRDDKGRTQVIWTTIADVTNKGPWPLAQVDHFIALGASGGGLFSDGVHIGNSWSRISQRGVTSGTVVDQFSLVALNTPAIDLALSGQAS